MTSIVALTLAATLSNPAAPPPEAAAERRPALLTQAVRLAERPPLTAPDASARLRFAQPGGDSLKNGAIIGGAIAGAGMGIFVYTLCKALDDTQGGANCAGPALLWTAIAGAGGAAAGAGIDALFDGAPAARVRFRF